MTNWTINLKRKDIAQAAEQSWEGLPSISVKAGRLGFKKDNGPGTAKGPQAVAIPVAGHVSRPGHGPPVTKLLYGCCPA